MARPRFDQNWTEISIRVTNTTALGHHFEKEQPEALHRGLRRTGLICVVITKFFTGRSDSDSRSLGIHRHSSLKLELLITRHGRPLAVTKPP
ncbi:hypothetical protein CRG98_025875 [Punica granatum]|uniref:Uncharacterized protein n=1 Tax=Punica granatum TaxID=22663 RepID=A0A2I0JBZ0_PUNGR|nr:hypothetical protein CRG98_025875 [Punica granatum]